MNASFGDLIALGLLRIFVFTNSLQISNLIVLSIRQLQYLFSGLFRFPLLVLTQKRSFH